jgi:hypothetical protein
MSSSVVEVHRHRYLADANGAPLLCPEVRGQHWRIKAKPSGSEEQSLRRAIKLATGRSFVDLSEGFGLVFVIIGVWQGWFFGSDRGPLLGILDIDLRVILPFIRKITLLEDGLGGALRDARTTINAFVWIDHQKISTLSEAIYWANCHTVGVFALNTRLSNNICHNKILLQLVRSLTTTPSHPLILLTGGKV